MAKPVKAFDDDLDGTPFAKCFQRIGHYMFSWACVESALNRLITTAMRLGSTEGVVVCANIQVRDKLYIAETAVHLQGSKGEAWQKIAKATIKKARTHSEDRNRVAHNFFAPEEGASDNIRFFIRKAKGKLEFPETVWTPKMLGEKIDSMMDVAADIERIAKELTPPPIGLLGGLAALGSYADALPPRPTRGLLGRAWAATPQAQTSPHAQGANRPSSPQTGGDWLEGLSLEDWTPPRGKGRPLFDFESELRPAKVEPEAKPKPKRKRKRKRSAQGRKTAD